MLTTNATISATKQFLFFSKIFTSLFHPYLSTKSSWQSPLTLPSSIPQLFFTNLFLRATIPTTYIKNIFPTANILEIQAASRDQGVREYCQNWHCCNLSHLLQSMGSDNTNHSQSLILYRSDSENWCIAGETNHQSTFSHILNLFSLLSYRTNTITRTQISLETSCLTWFSS